VITSNQPKRSVYFFYYGNLKQNQRIIEAAKAFELLEISVNLINIDQANLNKLYHKIVKKFWSYGFRDLQYWHIYLNTTWILKTKQVLRIIPAEIKTFLNPIGKKSFISKMKNYPVPYISSNARKVFKSVLENPHNLVWVENYYSYYLFPKNKFKLKANVIYDSPDFALGSPQLDMLDYYFIYETEKKLFSYVDLLLTPAEISIKYLSNIYDYKGLKAIFLNSFSENHFGDRRVPNQISTSAHDFFQHSKKLGLRILFFYGSITGGRNIEKLLRSILSKDSKWSLILMGEASIGLDINLDTRERVFRVPSYVGRDYETYMRIADAIVIPYPANSFNTKYSVATKFYDGIAFEVPIFVNSGLVSLSNWVKRFGIGMSFDFDKLDFEELSKKMSSTEVFESLDKIDSRNFEVAVSTLLLTKNAENLRVTIQKLLQKGI